jgi:hypothetical protein
VGPALAASVDRYSGGIIRFLGGIKWRVIRWDCLRLHESGICIMCAYFVPCKGEDCTYCDDAAYGSSHDAADLRA